MLLSISIKQSSRACGVAPAWRDVAVLAQTTAVATSERARVALNVCRFPAGPAARVNAECRLTTLVPVLARPDAFLTEKGPTRNDGAVAIWEARSNLPDSRPRRGNRHVSAPSDAPRVDAGRRLQFLCRRGFSDYE
jgi:hypothetical protein